MTYTGPVADDAAPTAAAGAHTNMPLLSPRTLPPADLLHHNALPKGAARPLPGAIAGSLSAAPPSEQPFAFGTGGPLPIAPYTTARASAENLGPTRDAAAVAVTSMPWSAAGQLTFDIAGVPYVCSGAMIAPGLLLTAGHCAYEFGSNSLAGWHTDFIFAPAQYAPGLPPPFGRWKATIAFVPDSYYKGTDTCMTGNVGCNDDLAILVMAPNGKQQLPGSVVGYFGYGWNGYGFTTSFGGASLGLITQLGYPVAFDGGALMQRTDGIGAYFASGTLLNTVLGSAMTGGASGGPWVVNFGAPPQITGAASLGSQALGNVVVGVTSWVYTAVGTNTTGASWFGQNTEFPDASYTDAQGISRGAGNIGSLVATACVAYPGAC